MNRCLIALGAIVVLGGSIYAWSNRLDPERRATELNRWVQDEFTRAIQGKSKLSVPEIEAHAVGRAKQDLKGVDPAQIKPEKAYAWSRLYRIAQDYETERVLLDRYLSHEPGTMAFTAQVAYLDSCVLSNDGALLAKRLESYKPKTDSENWSLASLVGMGYHGFLRDALGAKGAIAVIDRFESNLPKAPYAGEDARRSIQGARVRLTQAKAADLVELGRVGEAIALLKHTFAKLDKDIFGLDELAKDQRRYEMVSKPVPSLPAIKEIGGYKSLAALKGKVILLDFTAHWCKPCEKALPSLAELSNEFKADGLEILSVTQFYGHFQAERFEKKDMSRADELAKMVSWKKGHGVDWPLVFVSPAEFTAFNVRGIPHFVIIGRDGRIQTVDVGFSPHKFKSFREEVQRVLKVKAPE